MSKAPVTGTVAYVSKRGTEIRLLDDPKRYRGFKATHGVLGQRAARLTGTMTYPVFQGIEIGETVRLFWGGFADLNIYWVERLDPWCDGCDRPIIDGLGRHTVIDPCVPESSPFLYCDDCLLPALTYGGVEIPACCSR